MSNEQILYWNRFGVNLEDTLNKKVVIYHQTEGKADIATEQEIEPYAERLKRQLEKSDCQDQVDLGLIAMSVNPYHVAWALKPILKEFIERNPEVDEFKIALIEQ